MMKVKVSVSLERGPDASWEQDMGGATLDECAKGFQLPGFVPMNKGGKVWMYPASRVQYVTLEAVPEPPAQPEPEPVAAKRGPGRPRK
jgi:hypothetical protein